MISISVSDDTIKIRGHAGYAPRGQDIVCAGVTAITQTLVESIEGLTGNEIKYDMSPGRVDIEIKDPDEDAQLLMDSFFVGVEMIADEFPEYVRVEIRNDLDL
ncbi:ribosomal-processing cysteine protease Prp [Zhenpiania hominis]|uniref:ribosomal-processing cysteine protease Prp n=1 Tax=Zhenpiania hominis TaxID=2763644 RepID=UPI0039F5A9FF